MYKTAATKAQFRVGHLRTMECHPLIQRYADSIECAKAKRLATIAAKKPSQPRTFSWQKA